MTDVVPHIFGDECGVIESDPYAETIVVMPEAKVQPDGTLPAVTPSQFCVYNGMRDD